MSGSSGGGANYDLNTFVALQLEARNGRWGVLADIAYLDLGIIGTPPTSRHLNVDLDYKEFLGDLVGIYRIKETPGSYFDFYAGARVNGLSLDFQADANLVDHPLTRDIDESQSETWVDPVIGFRGQWSVSNNFFVAGKADIGGFGVSPDFLWSAQATLGYQFTNYFSTEIGYRYYDTDYENDGFVYDMAMGGLFLGFNFTF